MNEQISHKTKKQKKNKTQPEIVSSADTEHKKDKVEVKESSQRREGLLHKKTRRFAVREDEKAAKMKRSKRENNVHKHSKKLKQIASRRVLFSAQRKHNF